MSTSAAATVPSDTPTLPNLFDSIVAAAPPREAASAGAPAAHPRRDTLLEPIEWIVSFDDDEEDIVVPAPEPSAEALDLDDENVEVEVKVENLKSGIRRLVAAPPPLPPTVAASKPAPTPSAAPTLRIVAPPRSRFWGDSRDDF